MTGFGFGFGLGFGFGFRFGFGFGFGFSFGFGLEPVRGRVVAMTARVVSGGHPSVQEGEGKG